MDREKFKAASEAAEHWLSYISSVVNLGRDDDNFKRVISKEVIVEAAYWLMLRLQDEYLEHHQVLEESFDELRVHSDSSVLGFYYWSSAHEAAVGTAQLAMELLLYPPEEIENPTPERQRKEAERLLSFQWKKLEIPAAEWQERIRRERASLLEQIVRREEAEPLDWKKLKEATKRAPKQYELVRVLVESRDWIELAKLAGLVWQDELKSSGAVRQQIKRVNEKLETIGARVRIRPDGERAIADFF